MSIIPDTVPMNALARVWPDVEVQMTNLERETREFRESFGLPVHHATAGPATPLASEPVAIEPAVIEPVVIEAAVIEAAVIEPAVIEFHASAPVAAFSEADHRVAGVELLKKAGTRDATGTELMAAGEHFFKAYLSLENARLQGSDIAHCGICLWQAALAFFRCGARANLQRTQCGAPEELLLAMVLKPLEFPGGILGSRLRSALEPRHLRQLMRCVELALLCFRRAAEFGESDLGTYWEAIVLRGIGSFPECRQMAKDALLDRPGIAVAGVVSAIEAYLADFQKLGNVTRSLGKAQAEWFQPLALDSMTSLCESLDRDAFLSRTKAGQKKSMLGSAEGIALASRATALDAAGGRGIPVRHARLPARAA